MISRGSDGLADIATRITQALLPMANGAYLTTDLVLIASYLRLVSEDYDRAADVLVTDYNEIVSVLHEARAILPDKTLHGRIDAVIALVAPSLRISDLTVRTDQALKTLIDVHAAVEDAAERGLPKAADTNLQIWRFLENYAERRAYHGRG